MEGVGGGGEEEAVGVQDRGAGHQHQVGEGAAALQTVQVLPQTGPLHVRAAAGEGLAPFRRQQATEAQATRDKLCAYFNMPGAAAAPWQERYALLH